MTAPRHRACRAMQGARAWRRNRMIERRAARITADRANQAAAGPGQPGATAPSTMRIAARASLLSTRCVLAVPDGSLQGRPGRWIV